MSEATEASLSSANDQQPLSLQHCGEAQQPLTERREIDATELLDTKSLVDEEVVKATKAIPILLQQYGPLTLEQIHGNLPNSKDLELDSTRQVVDILVALELVGVVAASDEPSSPNRFVNLDGTPRFDNLLVVPNQLVDLLELGQNEMDDMVKRIQLLRQELVLPAAIRRQHALEFIQNKLIKEFPYLANDPLYSAAIDNLTKAAKKEQPQHSRKRQARV